MTHKDAEIILVALVQGVLDTVREFPDGAPAGPMYLAFQKVGLSLETFEMVMATLVKNGKIRKSGNLYFPL